MGNVSNSTAFVEAGQVSPVSRGGVRQRRFIATCAMSASYATSGDTLQIPTGVGTLKAVHVAPTYNGTRFIFWDGNVATPKLKAFVEGAAVFAEVANATDLSADTRVVELVFYQ